MMNLNTKLFWDKKISDEKIKLFKSLIYIHKNNVVVDLLHCSRGKLLDVGFGYGVLEDLLVKQAPELDLFGIDISERAIREIRFRVRGKFVVANAKKIPFNESFFDYVIALDVLEHFQINELKGVLKEVLRVLKNNGWFVVSVPLNESEDDKISNRHLVTFTESSIKEVLDKCNFKVERIEELYAFRNFYFLKSLFAKYLKFKKPNLIILFCRKK